MDITEVEVSLRVVRIYAHCGKCGARLPEPIRNTSLSSGLKIDRNGEVFRFNETYSYTCPVCGEKTESDMSYPRVEFREIEEE